MEAKDTVMSDERFLEWCGRHRVIGCGGNRKMEGVDREVSICEDCRALAQAKISFKAGEVEGYKQGLRMREPYWAGIREVVDWIEHHGGTIDGVRNQWQAQLKEWGIYKEV